MPPELEERKIGLSPAQVAGSALAAVSGALLASFAGTTGTIIGTAIGSVVATVGAALYTWSLRRTSAAVRRTAAQVRQTALTTGALPRPVVPNLRHKAGKDSTHPDAGDADSGARTEAEAEASAVRSLPWVKLAVASVGVTGVVLGGITAFEAVTGQPIASLVGGSDAHGTTLGNVGRGGSASTPDKQPTDKTTKTPSDDSSQAPAPGSDTSKTPTVPSSSDTPTPQPSETAEPSSQPSQDPEGAPAAPQPSTVP
jgi:hypothetical protein